MRFTVYFLYDESQGCEVDVQWDFDYRYETEFQTKG